MAPWQSCPYTASLIASIEIVIESPVAVVALHKQSYAPLFVLVEPTCAVRKRLKKLPCYWGSWKTVRGKSVLAYRPIHKDEITPPGNKPIAERLAAAEREL